MKRILFVAPRSTYWHRLVINRGIRTSTNEVLPSPPSLSSLTTSQETQEARRWIEKFKDTTIPKDVVEFTFSRSSGPGGQVCHAPPKVSIVPSIVMDIILRLYAQNVNKVSTKATLRCPVDAPWIPLWARESLRKSVGLRMLHVHYVFQVC